MFSKSLFKKIFVIAAFLVTPFQGNAAFVGSLGSESIKKGGDGVSQGRSPQQEIERLKDSYKVGVPKTVQTARGISTVFKTVLKDIEDFRGDDQGSAITLDKINEAAAEGKYLEQLFGFVCVDRGFIKDGFVQAFSKCFPSEENQLLAHFEQQGVLLRQLIVLSRQGKLNADHVANMKTVMGNFHMLFTAAKQKFDSYTLENAWLKGATTDAMQASYLGVGLKNNLARIEGWVGSLPAAFAPFAQPDRLAPAITLYRADSFFHILEDLRDMTGIMMKNTHRLVISDPSVFQATMQTMAGYLKTLLDLRRYLMEGAAYEAQYKAQDFKGREHLIAPRILKGIATRMWGESAEDDSEFETLYADKKEDADAKAAFIVETSQKLRDALTQIGRFVTPADVEKAKALIDGVKAFEGRAKELLDEGDADAAMAIVQSGDELVKIADHLEEAAEVIAAGARFASYRDQYQTKRSLVFAPHDLARWAEIFDGNIDVIVAKYEAMATAFMRDPNVYGAAYAVEENRFLSFDPQDFKSTFLLREVPFVIGQILGFYKTLAEGFQTPSDG